MADEVQFQQENEFAPINVVKRASGLTSWLIRSGFAKDEKQASVILLVAAVGIFVLAVVIFLFAGHQTAAPLPAGSVLVNDPGTPPHLEAPVP